MVTPPPTYAVQLKGFRVDDLLHEGIEGDDARHGNNEVSHRTLGVGGLDKVCDLLIKSAMVWHCRIFQ